MNQHVKRPDPSERPPFGLKLTDAQPLSGIPAVWRLAALLSTLLMGALALIGALYFGRSILLPVSAALIVGITLSPAVEFGERLKIPTAISAVARRAAADRRHRPGADLLRRAADRMDRARAGNPRRHAGAAARARISALGAARDQGRDRARGVDADGGGRIQHRRNGRHGPDRHHAGGQPVHPVLRHADFLSGSATCRCGASWSWRSVRATRGCA